MEGTNEKYNYRLKGWLLLIFLLALTSCKNSTSSEQEQYNFDSEEAYKFINNYFLPDNFKGEIYLCDRQLRQPNYELTSDSIVAFEMIDYPYPLYTKGFWDKSRISNVQFLPMDTLGYYPGLNLDSLWNIDLGEIDVYNFSFPLYNHNSKKLVIEVFIFEKNRLCGTDRMRYIFYQRQNGKWKKR